MPLDIKKIGFIAGIIAFLIAILAIPADNAIKNAIAVLLLCTIWWTTEATPIYATALLPAILFPLMQVLPLQDALSQYAHRVIFLFFAGFLIARAMIKWGLDRRIALFILAKGKDSQKLILYFMLATAFLSAFISNTATTAMMLPIGMAVLLHIKIKDKESYGKVLMLGIAYSATIGGVATLIGTPPNAIFAGFAESLLGEKISFFDWLKIGLPFFAIMMPIVWFFLIGFYKPEKVRFKAERFIEEEAKKLGKLKKEEMLVLFVFIFVAILWLTRPFWHLIGFSNLQNLLDDSIIALIGAVLLFIIPIDFKKWQSALALEDIQEIPFGILILFGGGLCLGKGLFESGAARWLAEKVPTGNVLLLLLLVIIITSFLTEVASNTAIANMMLPILIAIANNAEINPYYLLIPATLSCSLAFMFPISTPPNAIVFSSGYIKMHDMIKAGVILHVIGLVIIFMLGQFLFKLI